MSYYFFITSTGVFVPDTAGLLQEVQGEWIDAFGSDLVVTADTPQGVMINAETLARAGTLKNICQNANQINPNIAEGVFLDAIWALTGGRRIPNTQTRVTNVLMRGVVGAIIPAGAIARCTDNGEDFELVSAVTITLEPISGEGQAYGTFKAVNSGPIACPTNTLTQIVSAVIGWESVDNAEYQATPPITAAATTLGTLEESDEESRTRRRNTLAVQAVATSEAIISGLYNLVGVNSVSYLENYSNLPISIDDIALEPNSIWVCIDGGTTEDIGEVLVSKKACGCAWNGAEEITITDPWSLQDYVVKYDLPVLVPVKCEIRVKVTGGIGDPSTIVKKAILDYASGALALEDGFILGADVSAFEMGGAVNVVAPTIFVKDVKVALNDLGAGWQLVIAIKRNEKATIAESDIVVIVE